jgi:peptidoglycan/xylan/chitin deacetylase (PgdA/CDA1 family)
VRGDYSLDQSWQPFWQQLARDGHAFGSHTFDHVYVVRDLPDGRIAVKPQFGPQAGKILQWTQAEYCAELRRVTERFQQLTGQKMDPYWRAPGGRLTPGWCRLVSVAACVTQAGRPLVFPVTNCQANKSATPAC